MSEPTRFDLSCLFLDVENPRLYGANTTENGLIRMMARRQKHKLINLAADIVEKGLNPNSLFIVMSNGNEGQYTALDGNRRLSAIRLLERPDIAREELPVAAFERLRDLSRHYAAAPIDGVYCVVFSSRMEADHWIAMTHTGEMEGVGSVLWDSYERAKFLERVSGKPPALGAQVLDCLEIQGVIDTEDRRKIPVTNLTRLISTPEVRKVLGLDIERGIVKVDGEPESVLRALTYVARIFRDKEKTERDIHSSDQRREFASAFPAEFAAQPVTESGRSDMRGAALDTIELLNVPPLAKEKTGQTNSGYGFSTGNRQQPRRGNFLIPQTCFLHIKHQRTQAIAEELRKLNVHQTPNAVAVLFRVFLELSMDAYMAAENLTISNNRNRPPSLAEKLRSVAGDLKTKNRISENQERVVQRTAAGQNYESASVTVLNSYVHNDAMIPIPSDLLNHWDSIQPFIEAIWPRPNSTRPLPGL